MLAANPHVREEHQAGVIQHGPVAFLHAVQPGGQISELAQVKTRDAFVALGLVVVRRGMVPFAYFQEGIVERGKVAREPLSPQVTLYSTNPERTTGEQASSKAPAPARV